MPILVIWTPGLIRSYYFTGDPLFPVLGPFLPQHCDASRLFIRTCEDNRRAITWFREATRGYGYGHGPLGFIKAFFLAPLSRQLFSRQGFFFGQNKFDYPLGVFWFLSWGIFFYAWVKRKVDKNLLLAIGSMAFSLFLLWFFVSQQGRWLYPVILLLALFCGYFLATQDWRTKCSLRCLGLLVILIAGTVGLNAGKILLSQSSTLNCFGDSCLKFQAELYRDYHTLCHENDLSLPKRSHLGYLNCLVTNPRTDLPWVSDQ